MQIYNIFRFPGQVNLYFSTGLPEQIIIQFFCVFFVSSPFEIFRMTGIKNIVFDFGGVLIDLDRNACINAFIRLGMKDVDEYLSDYKPTNIFRKLETGEISPEQFRHEIRCITKKSLSNKEIDNAWLVLLLDVPDEKLEMLLTLRKNYRVFMLSNTNAIHIDNILRKTFDRNGHVFDDYFEKAYFSYQIGYVKPDKDIFEFMLNDAGIKAEETLFIDDSEINIITAKGMGFKTFQPKPLEDFSGIFENPDFLNF